MGPVNLDHKQFLATASKLIYLSTNTDAPVATEEKIFTSGSNSPSAIVTLSPESAKLSFEYEANSRFNSPEELSEHKTRLYSTWVTYDELESGKRRAFASPEDQRLSTLTLKELMEESLKLPNVDKNGHLQSSMEGTEQGDRINVAIANIILESQYNYRKAAKSVEASLEKFKQHIEEKLNIKPDSYDVMMVKGKITAVSKGKNGSDNATLKKIQDVLDKNEKIKPAKDLVSDIQNFNAAALKLIDNHLTQYIHGAQQNRYLSKNISADWLMEGMNYSHASTSNQVSGKYLSIVADAREKYHAALQDGSHLANGKTNVGILELTKLRQAPTP
jgi:hypothetical protein